MDRDRPLNSPATPGRIGRIVVRGEFGPLLSAANRGSANVDLADFAAGRSPKTIGGTFRVVRSTIIHLRRVMLAWTAGGSLRSGRPVVATVMHNERRPT
ncbi:MAG TPA: hypothetical protein VI094_14760 [Propionibacteriaceae bacterium]